MSLLCPNRVFSIWNLENSWTNSNFCFIAHGDKEDEVMAHGDKEDEVMAHGNKEDEEDR